MLNTVYMVDNIPIFSGTGTGTTHDLLNASQGEKSYLA
jgi:hypothetical protein